MYSVVVDPKNPSTVYAASSGLASYTGTVLTINARGGLFKSTDGGGSWNPAGSGLPESLQLGGRIMLAIDPQSSGALYAATDYGIFKSTDGAAGWTPVNSGLPPFETGTASNGANYFHADSVAIDPRHPDTVYAAIADPSGSRVFTTKDGGVSWSDASSGLPGGLFVRSLQIEPQIPNRHGGEPRRLATLYAGTTAGVFQSTDGGTRWAAANSGLTATWISDVAVDPRNASTLFAVTSIGLVKTADGGANWIPANSGLTGGGGFPLAIDPQNTSTLFAPGCTVPATCGLVKSTDGGTSWSLSWTAQDPMSNWITALAIDPRNSNMVYAATQGFDECGKETLHKSVDGGKTWSDSLFQNMGVSAGCVLELAVDPQNSDHLYAAFQDGGVFKSTDAGATWKEANSGLSPSGVSYGRPYYSAVALAIDPDSPGTVYTISSLGVFKSSDGGMSWNPANSGLPDWSREVGDCCFRPRLAVDPQNSARVYLGIAIDGAGKVFQSSDGGASWIDSGLAVSPGGWWFGGLAISSKGTVYAGSRGQGAFAFSRAVTMGVQ
jgi:photosystem II stability/assembly factor-like uncharacterized protein